MDEKINRRSFLKYAVATGAVIATGYLGLRVLSDSSAVSKDYSRALSLNQSIVNPKMKSPTEPIEIRYPGLYPAHLGVEIEVANNSDASLESLVVEQYGLDGFEFKEAKIGEKTISPVQVENGLQFKPDGKLQAKQKAKLILSYSTGWDSKTSDVRAVGRAVTEYYDQGGFLPAWLGDPHEGYRTQEVSSEPGALTVKIVPDPAVLREWHEQGREDLLAPIRARKLLLQYPLKDESARDAYWRDPSSENGRKVFDAFRSELAGAGEPYGELAEELGKLPDLKQSLFDEKMVKAGENIACDALLYGDQKEKTETMIRNILNEGIKGKRKYCSPLQAWLWYAKDEVSDEQSNPLLRFASVPGFIQHSWRNSSVSGNYTSDRWQDFDEVVGRLNTINLIDVYMKDNIHFKEAPPLTQVVPTALEAFTNKGGDCKYNSVFGTYCVLNSGGESYILGAFPHMDKSDGGHAVTSYNLHLSKDPITQSVSIIPNPGIMLFDNIKSRRRIKGPYKSIDEAANFVIPQPWVRYYVWDVNWNIIMQKSR